MPNDIIFWTVQFGQHWGGDASMRTLGEVFPKFEDAEDRYTSLTEAPDETSNFVWLSRVKASALTIIDKSPIELVGGEITSQVVLACRELLPPGLNTRIRSFVQSALDTGGLNLDGQTEAERILKELGDKE